MRVTTGAGVGYGLGAVLGAVTANWSDVPKILRDKPWPALKATGALLLLMHSCTLASVLAYICMFAAAKLFWGQSKA